MMSSLTINNSGAPRDIRHKQLGLSNRLPTAVTGGPALIGGVAMNNGLTIPDVAMRVGGAVALWVGQQDVIVHRLSARREELLVLIESDKSQLESATCGRCCMQKHFVCVWVCLWFQVAPKCLYIRTQIYLPMLTLPIDRQKKHPVSTQRPI